MSIKLTFCCCCRCSADVGSVRDIAAPRDAGLYGRRRSVWRSVRGGEGRIDRLGAPLAHRPAVTTTTARTRDQGSHAPLLCYQYDGRRCSERSVNVSTQFVSAIAVAQKISPTATHFSVASSVCRLSHFLDAICQVILWGLMRHCVR